MDYFNFSLKQCFLFDPTLKSSLRKPTEDEQQDAKILYYYPNNEDNIIKRSNTGIVEGTIGFLEAFGSKNTQENNNDDNILLTELTNCLYIANKVEDNIYLVFLLEKGCSSKSCLHTNNNINSNINNDKENLTGVNSSFVSGSLEYTVNVDVKSKRKWFSEFLKYFYDSFYFYNGKLKDIFFEESNSNKIIDLREEKEVYNKICYAINDFVEGFFDNLASGTRLPLLNNVLYFPLNETSYAQILLASQRLSEKISDVKYTSILYKGYLLHNEISMDSFSIIYNSLFSNIDLSSKFYTFSKPNYKTLQTVPTHDYKQGQEDKIISSFRKSFEISPNYNGSQYLVGINKINLNSFQVFIPTIYLKSTKEILKLLIYYYNGLVIIILLNKNFNVPNQLLNLNKIDKWVKRYFDEDLKIIETLYQTKMSKVDSYAYAYVNNLNRSIKISTNFFSKKNKSTEKERLDNIFNLLRINYLNNNSSIIKLKGQIFYFLKSCSRNLIVAVNESQLQNGFEEYLEDLKKDLFDYIFIL